MPKRTNIKKSAAALFQNQQKITMAQNGAKVVFAAVEKALGRSQFRVKLSGGKMITATPRGLFKKSKGTVRISVGQVVIIEGIDRPEEDHRAELPWEIVARLDDTAEIKKLIKDGSMPADILGFATTAGTVDSGAIAAEDDLFENSGSDEEFWQVDVRGGVRATRKAEETQRSIASRVATLKAGGAGGDGGAVVGNAADPTLSDADYERFKRWRASKPKAAPAPAVEAIVEVFTHISSACEEAAAYAKAAEIREFMNMRHAKENWDDEDEIEIDLNDL